MGYGKVNHLFLVNHPTLIIFYWLFLLELSRIKFIDIRYLFTSQRTTNKTGNH